MISIRSDRVHLVNFAEQPRVRWRDVVGKRRGKRGGQGRREGGGGKAFSSLSMKFATCKTIVADERESGGSGSSSGSDGSGSNSSSNRRVSCSLFPLLPRTLAQRR